MIMDRDNNMDACTQVDLSSEDIEELKKRNKELEKLHYNTLFNSGKLSLHDEIQQIIDNDELISLRNEFKNLIHINKQLKEEKEKERYKCCVVGCCIL